MSFLCKRCYINKNKLKKNDIKKLVVTSENFECDECGKFTKLVIEPRGKEQYYDENYN
jgi:hypothetical protein